MWVYIFKILKKKVYTYLGAKSRELWQSVYLFELSRTLKKLYIYPSNLKEATVFCVTF